MRIPVAEFMPDQPAFENPGSGMISGCVFRTDRSVGPYPGLQNYGGALTTACQGAYACTDSSDNVYVFAGDHQNLWEYTSASTTPSMVSISNNAYNIATGERWNFALFGQRVIATDYADTPQGFILGSSSAFGNLGVIYQYAAPTIASGGTGYGNAQTFTVTLAGGTGTAGTASVTSNSSGVVTTINSFTPGSYSVAPSTPNTPTGGTGTGLSLNLSLSYAAPKARYITVTKGFLMLANTSDTVGGMNPQRVWWSSYNDPTNWPVPGTATAAQNQSSFQDLFCDGGWIKGVVGGLATADCAVFMERAVWQGFYVGPPAVFNFYQIEGVRGTEAPGSIAQDGRQVFYLGIDGVYQFDGTNSVPIGFQKVDEYIQSTLNTTYIGLVTGTIDPLNRLYMLAYPSTNSAGTIDTILAYHWPTKKWSLLMANSEIIFRGLTFGNNVLDNVGSVSLDTASWNLFPMDSSVWEGGQPLMAAFDTSHRLSFFNGSNLAAIIDTTEVQPVQGQRTFLNGGEIRPLVDGGTPSVAIGVRNRLVDSVAFNTATAMNGIGTCPQTTEGRYMRAEITIPAGTSWNHCLGLDVADDNFVANGVM